MRSSLDTVCLTELFLPLRFSCQFDALPKFFIIGSMNLHTLRSRCARHFSWLALICAFALTLFSPPVLADNPTINTVVSLAPLDPTAGVEMVALTLDANMIDSNAHTIVTGNTTFKLHNLSKVAPVTVSVGFPAWGGGALSFDPAQFSGFSVSSEDKKIPLSTATAPLKLGAETRTVNWYTLDVLLDADEKQLIRADFTLDLGSGSFPRFTYGLMPANNWKGTVDSARLTLHFASSTTMEQFMSIDPAQKDFDGKSLTWLFIDFNPSANPAASFIRPAVWNDLISKRASAAQNPNDANLHFAVGQIYQQLASVDSPRRENFVAQALAELEVAARLNPKNVDAVTALAQVYETRAGAAAGPRDPNYVALSLAQWQNLIGTRADADARKHSAEDSFALGLEARARGDNELALKYFDDANKFSPAGAGPLYTRPRWQAETQAANVALTKSLLDEGKIGPALTRARAAFGEEFTLAPAPTPPAFAISHASVNTSSSERRVVVHLLPYPGTSDEAKTIASQLADSLNKVAVGSIAFGASDSDYTIQIGVPFDSDSDLKNKLGKLARAIPDRSDWNLLRSIVNPSTLEWNERSETYSSVAHYRENVDLQTAQAGLQANLNDLNRTVADLQKAPPDDVKAQLRLAMLRDAQDWWRRVQASASITYQAQTSSGATREWNIRPGEKQVLTYEANDIRTEWLVLGGIGAAVVLLVVLLLVFLIVGRRRGAPAEA